MNAVIRSLMAAVLALSPPIIAAWKIRLVWNTSDGIISQWIAIAAPSLRRISSSSGVPGKGRRLIVGMLAPLLTAKHMGTVPEPREPRQDARGSLLHSN